MDPDKATTRKRCRMLRGAVAGMLLLARTFVLANTTRAVAAGPSTVEAAPSVKAAVDGVLELFRKNSVVALADAHGLAQEEAFYSAIVRDPRFVEEVDNVVVEFGGELSQDIIDRYVAGEDVPLAELRRVWTETIGWIPGPTSLGYVNFYANVRAANLKLSPEHRIKVWLGDPKVDWSKINSFADAAPYLSRRDDNFFRIISDDILGKQKRTLLIIGGGHLFAPLGAGPLSARISGAYPHALAVVSPFTGYVEPECNARVVARAKDWPVPAVVGPVQGTWLNQNCCYLDAITLQLSFPSARVRISPRRISARQARRAAWYGLVRASHRPQTRRSARRRQSQARRRAYSGSGRVSHRPRKKWRVP